MREGPDRACPAAADVHPSIDCSPSGRLHGCLPQGFKVLPGTLSSVNTRLGRKHAVLQVLITGASQGCGQAMAVAFAQAGASDVFVTARSAGNLRETEALIAKLGTRARVHSHALDVQSQQQVDEVVPQVLQARRPLLHSSTAPRAM